MTVPSSAVIRYGIQPTDFSIKQGDTGPSLAITMTYDDGTAVNLTSATVTFSMRTTVGGSVVVNKVGCQINDATNGKAQYNWSAADTATAGNYLGEFEVTLSNGQILTVPNDSYIGIGIFTEL